MASFFLRLIFFVYIYLNGDANFIYLHYLKIFTDKDFIFHKKLVEYYYSCIFI